MVGLAFGHVYKNVVKSEGHDHDHELAHFEDMIISSHCARNVM